MLNGDGYTSVMDWNRSRKPSVGLGLLRWQAGVFAVVLGFVTLAPRPGSATLLLTLAGPGPDQTLVREIARGAAIAGKGPAGGTLLVHAQPGIGLRALLEGTLAIRVPESLCSGSGMTNG